MSTPDSDEHEYNEEDFKAYIQRSVRQDVRRAVRGAEAVEGVDMGEELMQRAEDVYFCLYVHALHVAQGQPQKDVAGEETATERVGIALSNVAAGDSYAAPLARRLLDAPPDDLGRVARLVLWAMIGTPEHERMAGNPFVTIHYLQGG